MAGSVALTGFGFDSFIEVATAAVVLARLHADLRGGRVDAAKRARALRFVAATFFLLAAYVTVEGVRDLLGDAVPEASPVGIAITGLSVLVMPTLAWRKRRAGERLGSKLVVADAAETRLCAWLSASTLGWARGLRGVRLNLAGPAAGFVIAAFAIWEGGEAWDGELPEDDDGAASP